MFRHLSLQEKIELLLGTRTSGGGLPLPEAFGAALSYLHDKGTTSDDVLRKVIRDKRQVEFRESRILEVCDDWDSFCTVIEDVLEYEELVTRENGSWSLTGKAVPGKELTVMRIVTEGKDRRSRVTFFGEEHRKYRNEVDVFKNELDALAARIPGLSYISPTAGETVNQYLLACSQVLREALSGSSQGKQRDFPLPSLPPQVHKGRRIPGQADWYRRWMRTAGWHSIMMHALPAWNEEHPGMEIANVSLFSARNEANRLLKRGEMERRDSTLMGGDFWEYRWTGASAIYRD